MNRILQDMALMDNSFVIVPLFMVGCIIGSFLNVCVYRLPRGMSVVTEHSHCVSCGHSISWYDNIPLLSYLFLFGKCRHCRARISIRYPMVEGLNGLLYLLIFLRFGPTLETVAYSVFASLLLVSSFTDLEKDDDGEMYLIIPDVVSVPGTVAGVLLSLALPRMTLTDSLLGVAVGGGSLYLVMRIVPRGMGEGDTKLSAMMGAFLGWKMALFGIYLGVIIGAVVGVVLLVLKIRGRKDAVPFGPFLAMGALIALFYGERLIARLL